MKGYKAFDADFKCRGKQYEAGKTYEEPEAKLCEAGMHFCEKPFDVLDFYPVVGDDLRLTRFAEVEAEEPKADSDKKKYVTKKLTVGAELGIAGFDSDSRAICVGMKAAQIDGSTLKADTWYTLQGGEFVEVQDNAKDET